MKTTTLTVEVDYDPTITDPERLASSLDILLETTLSTPGILEDHGNLTIHPFFAQETEVR